MNEQDLRDCFAMFAMMGLVMREGVVEKGLEVDAWVMADKMMDTRNTNYRYEEDEGGITAVKPKRKPK